MTIEGLKLKLFEVMFALDDKSAGRDYVALRNQHYRNMQWINENELSDEYYNYFFSQIKPRLEAENKARREKE